MTAARVRILRIAAGGDGVGRLPDGRTVFVPRAAPDDLVELTRVQTHRRFARGRIGRVLELGPDRVAPRCPHYDRDECGGCQLQHLSPPAQLAAKRAIVGDALRRLARLDLPDPEIVPSDSAWAYRTKLTLAIAPGGRSIGLRRFDRPDEIFDLDRCEIALPALMDLWHALARNRHRLPPDGSHLVLRLDREGGRHVLVQAAGARAWASAGDLALALERERVPATVWWQPEGGAPRVVAGALEAYPAIVFEQVHPELAERIRDFALEQLGEVIGRHVWDLYAGIGETTDRLAGRGATVESVELDGRAVALAVRREERQSGVPENSQRPRRSLITRHSGLAEALVSRLKRPDLVVTNPPRIGMHERVIAAIREQRPGRVVYLSCDPATLARDVARLGPSYRVTVVRAFDLFPQTAHVECVLVLEAV